MSVNNQNSEGWVQPRSNAKWSIDRDRTVNRDRPFKKDNRSQSQSQNYKKVIKEKIPDVVADMLVTEFLNLVGDSNWNNPLNVSATIAKMMTIDLNLPIEEQVPHSTEIERTVFVPSSKDSEVPYWICQSLIRVDEKFGNRFIDYKGAKYNKIDIVFGCERFKERMNQVAKAAHCTWNARWGNSPQAENRLYQKTRTGSQSNESWLEKAVKHLLTDKDVGGINIKNLIMIEFKRDLSLLRRKTNETTEPVVVVGQKEVQDIDSDTEEESVIVEAEDAE